MVKYQSFEFIWFNEMPIKLQKNIEQQNIIVPLFVVTFLYTYEH